MQVVIIHGQQHQGNTYRLTQMLLHKLHCTPTEIQTFFVNGMPQCVGCCQCMMQDETRCPHHEQVAPILTALDQADVILLTSPNYCFEMTGQLKSFCDHVAYRWMIHRPADLRQKIGVALSTAAGGGARSVTKSLRRQMQWWSVGRVYQLSFLMQVENWADIPTRRMRKLE